LAIDSKSQILNELQRNLRIEGIEEVRLIKDKRTGTNHSNVADLSNILPTGQSRQFAFAQFASIKEAKWFLERYYPSLSLYGTYNPNQGADAEPTKVRVAYSREKDDRDRPGKGDDDWKCDIVCSTLRLGKGSSILTDISAFLPIMPIECCVFDAMHQGLVRSLVNTTLPLLMI
jgi:hypothetical protein